MCVCVLPGKALLGLGVHFTYLRLLEPATGCLLHLCDVLNVSKRGTWWTNPHADKCLLILGQHYRVNVGKSCFDIVTRG